METKTQKMKWVKIACQAVSQVLTAIHIENICVCVYIYMCVCVCVCVL